MSLKQTLIFSLKEYQINEGGNKSLVWDGEKRKKKQKKPKTKPGHVAFSEDKWSTPGVLPPKARASSEDLTHRLIPFLSRVTLTPYPFSHLFVTQFLGLRLKLNTRELPSNHGAPPPTLHASLMPSTGLAHSWTIIIRDQFQKFWALCKALEQENTYGSSKF